MSLTFNTAGAWNYLTQCLTEAVERIMDWYVNELSGGGTGSGLSGEGLAATEIGEAKKIGEAMIVKQVSFYADAIVESYGTGSLADTGEYSFWKEYASQKGANGFNPSRTTKYIVGRPRGSYSDLWGKRHSTWGSAEGVNLEGRSYRDSTGRLKTIYPIKPNYAIQNAEKRLGNGVKVKMEVDMAIEKWVAGIGQFFVER